MEQQSQQPNTQTAYSILSIFGQLLVIFIIYVLFIFRSNTSNPDLQKYFPKLFV